MSKTTIIRFHITPQTHVRRTHGDDMMFKIPEECPKHCGLPRRSSKAPLVDAPDHKHPGKTRKVRYGCPHMLSQAGLDRKRRLEKYTQYKIALNALAKQMRFSVPSFGFSLYFFMPIPPSVYSTKRKRLHGTIHHQRPDYDNLIKAWQDALVKQDGVIGQLSGIGKFWVDVPADQGWIEVHLDQQIYDPFGRYGSKELVFLAPRDSRSKKKKYLEDALLNTDNSQIVYADKDSPEAFDSPLEKNHVFLDEMGKYKDMAVEAPPQGAIINGMLHKGKFPDKINASDPEAMEKMKELYGKRKRK
jgi:Holliday junction resolvase RusA-like endonuclease